MFTVLAPCLCSDLLPKYLVRQWNMVQGCVSAPWKPSLFQLIPKFCTCRSAIERVLLQGKIEKLRINFLKLLVHFILVRSHILLKAIKVFFRESSYKIFPLCCQANYIMYEEIPFQSLTPRTKLSGYRVYGSSLLCASNPKS